MTKSMERRHTSEGRRNQGIGSHVCHKYREETTEIQDQMIRQHRLSEIRRTPVYILT